MQYKYFNKFDIHNALSDLKAGIHKYKIWSKLSWMAIRDQYQRSTIGPFWISLNTLILVLAFGVVYGQMLDIDLQKHLPYVGAGLVIWYLYSSVVINGCLLFISNRQMIQQIPLPYSVYLFRLVTQESIIFLHNLVVVLAIFLFFQYSITVKAFISLLSIVLIIFNAACLAFLFGVISTRFRDFPQIVRSLMQPMMFLTPIIWSAETFPNRTVFIDFNPLYHIVELWRAPLLGQVPNMYSWITVILLTLVIAIMAFFLFARYRRRIAYWV